MYIRNDVSTLRKWPAVLLAVVQTTPPLLSRNSNFKATEQSNMGRRADSCVSACVRDDGLVRFTVIIIIMEPSERVETDMNMCVCVTYDLLTLNHLSIALHQTTLWTFPLFPTRSNRLVFSTRSQLNSYANS